MGQPIVGDESDTEVVEEWSDESDTIAHRIRAVRGANRNQTDRWPERRRTESAEGDPDGGQGQWPAHRGIGDCPVACGVDLALVRAARHCLVPGRRPRRPLHRHPPTLRAHSGGGGRPGGVWWWDHGQCWGSDVRHGVVPVLWRRDQEGEDSGVDENEWDPGNQEKRRCKGDASAMQGRHTGDARRTPRALPWQPHGSGADLRWKGRREEENNAPVQSDQLLRRTGVAHQDKVQTGMQTGQVTVTVTHNMEERRRDGWQREGEAPENRKDRVTRGRGQARRQRQRVEKMVDRGTRGKGAGGLAAGWGVGNPALRECARRSGACDWLW